MSEVKTNKISSLASNNDITIDPNGTGKVAFVSDITMTSDDPTITMTDSSGTNDIATIQATSGALIVTARDGSADGEIIFKKNDGSTTDETMRINSSGNILIGRSDTNSNTGGHFITPNYGFFENDGTPFFVNRYNSNGDLVIFRKSNSGVGSISTNGSSTSYNTSSDYRLKENVTATWDATTRLKQLNPVRFNFIADADTTVDGFLAHEAQAVVPESVTGTKDAVDDDGNPVYQGIDQAKLVPLLVKTIQELEARITALEAE